MTMWRGDESSAARNLDGYIFEYKEPKYLHECAHCGFEADLYMNQPDYECPMCKQGTMCRAPCAVVWVQDYGSSDASFQRGFYYGDV